MLFIISMLGAWICSHALARVLGFFHALLSAVYCTCGLVVGGREWKREIATRKKKKVDVEKERTTQDTTVRSTVELLYMPDKKVISLIDAAFFFFFFFVRHPCIIYRVLFFFFPTSTRPRLLRFGFFGIEMQNMLCVCFLVWCTIQ